VHLLALGPLTNIGEAIQMVPGSFRSVEQIVISGGAVAVPGNLGDGGYYQTDNTTAEWNIYLDAFAAKLVFESGMRITLVPLDVTNRVRIDHQFLQAFRDAGHSPLAGVVKDVLEANREYIDRGLYYAWDPFVAAVMTNPGIVGMKAMAVEVQQLPPEEGRTMATPNRRHNASVALVPDLQAFRNSLFGVFGIR
jgi:inosine-uridine nucleoside N-ribohydrolase